MSQSRRSLATVVAASAALALVVGGGVGYAAGALPKNSVASAQIKNGAVKGKDLKDDAVTGAKVKDGSLSGAELAANSVTGAQVDESTLALPSKPGSILVGGTAFTPHQSSQGYFSWSVGGRSLAAEGLMVASVPLPHGATPTSITFYVIDNGPGAVQVSSSAIDLEDTAYLPGDGGVSAGAALASQAVTVPAPALAPGWVLELRTMLPATTGPGFSNSYAIIGAKVTYQ